MEPTTLDEIKELAALLYTPMDIALILDLDLTEVQAMMKNSESDFFRAYYAGYHETDIGIRNSIFKLAKNGSSPAQAMAKKIAEENEVRRFYDQ